MSTDGSRIPGFYRLSVEERRRALTGLSEKDHEILDQGGLTPDTADHVVENVIGIYSLAFGLAVNFRVNDRDYLVPMVVEEPSVIAGASNAARLVRAGGGFLADADEPLMTAQIEVQEVADVEAAKARLEAGASELLALAHAALPRLVDRGGGARTLEVRSLPGRVILHVQVDCRDAMGANMVNTIAEALADRAADLAGGRRGLRILTNLCDRRCVRVTARVPAHELATPDMPGPAVRDGIVAASLLAEDDPYRAATHNKGIMNGVDAVVMATGNDWRGVEAGAHAFAAIDGRYRPLAIWRADSTGPLAGAGGEPDLVGELEMPMAIGTVGGTLHAHEGAQLAQRLLGVTDARTLAMVIGSAGLASNLAALRALATDGIQRGHMALHRRSHAFNGGGG
ncbi:MAG TPA: hydroxymethylglutaryl-CoA reductase, degradative [Polyangia bacterium]|jgi:hydroxymethylglutaryl-CoA reductase